MATSLCISLLAFAVSAAGQAVVLPLWPHGTPEPPQTTAAEIDVTKPTDALFDGKRSIRYTNVTQPTLTVFAPPPAKSNGAAAVVFPGGGYVRLAWNGEGTDTCAWLNNIGVTCVLVKYRVPEVGRYPDNYADFEDAQQAMRLTRAHAKDWHIDPAKVGVIGYSAGAHLAVVLATHWDDRHVESTPAAADVDTTISAHPAFDFVIYPGYLAAAPDRLHVEPLLKPVPGTPPTFLLQAEDDSTANADSSLVYFRALRDAKIPAEMHLFATGGHGFGVHPTGKPEENWTQLATTWLRSIHMVP